MTKYLPSLISVLGGLIFGLAFYVVTKGNDNPTTVAFSIFLGIILDIYITNKNNPENTEKINSIEQSLKAADKFIKPYFKQE